MNADISKIMPREWVDLTYPFRNDRCPFKATDCFDLHASEI